MFVKRENQWVLTRMGMLTKTILRQYQAGVALKLQFKFLNEVP